MEVIAVGRGCGRRVRLQEVRGRGAVGPAARHPLVLQSRAAMHPDRLGLANKKPLHSDGPTPTRLAPAGAFGAFRRKLLETTRGIQKSGRFRRV